MNEKMQIGVVGLGLMGTSIATCILAAGHQVTSLTIDMEKAGEARKKILNFLGQLQEEGILREDSNTVIRRLTITDDYSLFASHEVVIESIIEND